MNAGFVGLGTAINVFAVVLGSAAGLTIGSRLKDHTRDVVTDCLGLVTLLMAALNAFMVTDPALEEATGAGAPVLVVLGALLIGSISGSLWRIEARLAGLGAKVQAGVARRSRNQNDDQASRDRFVQGWLTASLLFCIGPLTVLGSLNDGLGRGIDQLVLKSVLDCFASLAFASTFGVGVMFSAVSVLVVQGGLTLVGVLLGSVLPDAHIAALTATGGLMLVAISFRLLKIREIPVGDMLPALVVAPLLTQVVIWLR